MKLAPKKTAQGATDDCTRVRRLDYALTSEHVNVFDVLVNAAQDDDEME